jgi:hypothetical protein
MIVLIVISVVPLAYLLAAAWRWRLRHRDDPMGQRERAFAALRHWAESPQAQLSELAERTPALSGHVRILSERPAGMPRPRRQPSTRRARTGTRRRRTSTTSHPKIAVIPTSPSVTSSPGTTKDKTPRRRGIEVLTHPSGVSDLDRVAHKVEANASAEGTRSHDTVRVTLRRGEAEGLRDEISEKLSSGPVGVGRSGGRSRSKRRTGGSPDAIKQAIKQALDHTDRMTDHPRPPMS